jgi:putative ABC transport system permease protein
VSPLFFQTVGISLLEGRDFTWLDDKTSAPVAIISLSLQRELFSSGQALGRHIRIANDPQLRTVEVVGVVSDASITGLREPHVRVVYRPFLQGLARLPVVHVRTAAPLDAVSGPIQQAVKSLGHEYVRIVYATDDWKDRALLQERLLAMLSSLFGGLALALAFIGIYTLLAYSVVRRTREIGIRMALGSSPASAVRLVLRQVAAVLGAGGAIGIVGSIWTSRFVAALLYGVQPHDVRTLVGAALILGGIGLLAGWFPARRAARVDPMIALRAE